MGKKIRADMILRQITKRHNGRIPDAFFTEVKNGSTWFSEHLLRLDAVAIKKSWKKPCITGYEVKVDRQDFLRDEKWPGYRQYCHRFYFSCPVGLIALEELPDDIGLIYYNPDKDCISTKRTALFREIEIPWDMLYYLVVSRLDSNKHPFFSSRREFLEAWVQDKEERRDLGYTVRNKMAENIMEFQKRAKQAEREAKQYKDEVEMYERLKQIMERHGVNTYHWHIEKALEEALRQGMTSNLLGGLRTISREVDRLIAAMGEGEKAEGVMP